MLLAFTRTCQFFDMHPHSYGIVNIGCISNFWTLGGELRLRIPVRLPRVFEKDTAQGEEGIEVGHIPAHARPFNAGGGQPFARTLNRPRADEVPPLAIRAV